MNDDLLLWAKKKEEGQAKQDKFRFKKLSEHILNAVRLPHLQQKLQKSTLKLSANILIHFFILAN